MSNLFQGSSDGLLEEEKLIFGNGNILFSEGDLSNYLYLIKKGKVLLVKEEKGHLRKIEILKNKEIIGLSSLISDKKQVYTSFAVGRVEVIKVKKSEIKGILAKCEPWLMNLMKVICDRLNKTIEILENHHLLEEINFQDDDLGGLSTEELYINLENYREEKGKKETERF
jgi:CRP-like cAMP-binding protein